VIAYDPEPDGDPTAIRSALEAWSAVADTATHHLVLQDDVEPCAQFDRLLGDVVSLAPRSAICLFTIWMGRRAQRLRLAASLGHRLIVTSPQNISPEAIVMPSGHARAYAALLRDQLASDRIDSRDSPLLQALLHRRAVPVVVTIPNLVDHDTRALPTLMPRTGRPAGIRRSAYFVTDPVKSGVGWDRRSSVGEMDGFDLPILSDDLVGEVLTENGRSTTWQWLATRGQFSEELIAAARDFADRCRDTSGPMAWLSDSVLIEAWSVVYAMGMVVGRSAGGRRIAEDASFALSTILPGTLGRVLHARALEEVREAGAVFHHVLVAGARAASEPGQQPGAADEPGR
jgi:hypothetical protein